MRVGALCLLCMCAAVAACGGNDDGGLARPFDVVDAQGNEIGSTCGQDADCGDPANGAECCTGGKCGPDGWCSPRCASDRDCPEDFVCVDHDGSRCFLICETDRDCPESFLCEDKDQRLSCRYKEL